MPSRKISIALVFVSVLLTACATGYQRDSAWNMLKLNAGGFGEERISDSAYWVYFAGNGYASSERVTNFWLYRCAELTIEKGFDYMVIRPGEKQAALPSASPPGRWAHATDRGDDRPQLHDGVYRPSQPGRLVPARTAYVYVPGPTTTVTTWTSRGTVLMHRAPLPDELVYALDARKIKSQLDPFVKSDGKSVAPSRATLVTNALVTHARITFGSDKSIAVAVPGSALSPRDMQEIRSRFDDAVIGFHSMFRTRKHVAGLTNGGTIELALTVTPSGDISESAVQSTTFQDQIFVDAVANSVRRLTYAPKDVATTRVASFPIVFQPLTYAPAKPAPGSEQTGPANPQSTAPASATPLPTTP